MNPSIKFVVLQNTFVSDVVQQDITAGGGTYNVPNAFYLAVNGCSPNQLIANPIVPYFEVHGLNNLSGITIWTGGSKGVINTNPNNLNDVQEVQFYYSIEFSSIAAFPASGSIQEPLNMIPITYEGATLNPSPASFTLEYGVEPNPQCAAAFTEGIIIFLDSITNVTETPSPKSKKKIRPKEQLDFLYAIRDNFLSSSAKGKEYINTFNEHNLELLKILTLHPVILKNVDELVITFMKEIDVKAISAAHLTKETAHKVKHVMMEVSKSASANLKKTMETYMAEIDGFVGKPFGDIMK